MWEGGVSTIILEKKKARNLLRTILLWQSIRDDFKTFLCDMPQEVVEMITVVAA